MIGESGLNRKEKLNTILQEQGETGLIDYLISCVEKLEEILDIEETITKEKLEFTTRDELDIIGLIKIMVIHLNEAYKRLPLKWVEDGLGIHITKATLELGLVADYFKEKSNG